MSGGCFKPDELGALAGDLALDDPRRSHLEECPRCQRRIRKEGLANEDELQSWFIQRIESFLLQNGRRLIGRSPTSCSRTSPIGSVTR